MRIAFFVSKFPLPSETFIMNSAVALLDAGHEVDIYNLHGFGTLNARHSLLDQHDLIARSHPPRYAAQGAAARWLGAPGAFLRIARDASLRRACSGLDVRAYRSLALTMRPIHELETFRDQGRYDVLHCHYGTLAEPVLRHRAAGSLTGAVVVHFRGRDISSQVQQHGAQIYSRVFREADAFIANSAYFRDHAISLGCPAERIEVVESPVNLGLFPFAARSHRPGKPIRLLTVGRLVEKKGIEYAIKATGMLIDQGIAVEHHIIGEGIERPSLERLIAAGKLDRHVKLLGERSQDYIAAELADADLFVAPSVLGRDGSADAAINTLKEAMASGLPVVSTYHGGIPELVQDGESGYLVAERDAPAIADRLGKLIAEPESWAAMGAAGRRAVEDRFAFPAIARLTLDTYAGAAYNYANASGSKQANVNAVSGARYAR